MAVKSETTEFCKNCFSLLHIELIFLFLKVLGQIMTMSDIVDLRNYNDNLIMLFVIQAIVNFHKANDLIIFFIDVDTTCKLMQINCWNEVYTNVSLWWMHQWMHQCEFKFSIFCLYKNIKDRNVYIFSCMCEILFITSKKDVSIIRECLATCFMCGKDDACEVFGVVYF